MGDVVLAMELVFAKDGDEDVLGENVLDDHLPDIGQHDVGIDGLLTKLQKIISGLDEGRIRGSLLLITRRNSSSQSGKSSLNLSMAARKVCTSGGS